MPKVTRFFLKTGLVYLVLGLAAGIFPQALGLLFPVYVHAIAVGWLTQLIFGVAFWLFPIESRQKPRPDERPMWAVYFLLNAGMVGRAVAEPAAATWGGPVWAAVLVASAVLLWASGAVFAVAIWPRVRER